LLEQVAAAVGVVQGATPNGVMMSARNGGGWPGRSGMNFIALASGAAGDSNLIVDCGTTGLATLPPTGGSIVRPLEVFFALPFSTPPIVLITANEAGLPAGESAVAALGVATGITTHGFVVEAMNTDSAPGRASFHWVAMGCGISCGAGPDPKKKAPPIKQPVKPPVSPPVTPPVTPRPGRSTGGA
jgi:hypothetical protein